MPEFTIEGDPEGIRTQAQTMRTRGREFVDTGDALARIQIDGWRGRAADRFTDEFEVEPRRWRDAGEGFVRAAQALEGWAEAVAQAQAVAEWAEGEYARGQQVTEQARAAYDAEIAQARADQAAASARGMFQSVHIVPFTDPGEEIRQHAVAELEQARQNLENEAGVCANGVRAGCAQAPQERRWYDRVGAFFTGAGEAAWDLGKLNPLGLPFWVSKGRELTDDLGDLTREEFMGKYRLQQEQYQGLWTALQDDPAGFSKHMGKAMLDWYTWADNPARAAGRLVPDAVIGALTAGTATGATRGADAGADALDALGDMGKKTDNLGQLDGLDAGDAGTLVGTLDGGPGVEIPDATPLPEPTQKLSQDLFPFLQESSPTPEAEAIPGKKPEMEASIDAELEQQALADGWPKLPWEGGADTFDGEIGPTTLTAGETYYRSVGDGSWPNGSFWSKEPPASESELRSDFAVLNDWNGDRGLVQFTPNHDIPGWEGRTAAQWTDDGTGYLPGGAEQIWIERGRYGPEDGDWKIGPAPQHGE